MRPHPTFFILSFHGKAPIALYEYLGRYLLGNTGVATVVILSSERYFDVRLGHVFTFLRHASMHGRV